MTTASAPGKIILFGEHAVVYGRPALAVPLPQLRATARVEDSSGGITIHAPDLGRRFDLRTAPASDPLAAIVRLTLDALGQTSPPALDIDVRSDIPIAGGMGSGAAVSTAIVRALAAHFERTLDPAAVSALVYESEKLYHGTPSGIDNTVIAYEQAIRFTRASGPQIIRIAGPFTLVIADTGTSSPTRITVGDVRKSWEKERERYEELFDRVGGIVEQAQAALERGDTGQLGPLMTQNQRLLEEIGVSSVEIERLVAAALAAGAGGAKLSGGGRGGNVIAQIEPGRAEEVRQALLSAGAVRALVTEIS